MILHLDSGSIAKFQPELRAMGYKFQFVTLAGFHALNYSMFQLTQGCRDRGMTAYADCRRRNSPRNAMVTRRRNTSAKSAPVTSISSPKLSPMAKARPRRWMARPKRSSSVECKFDDRQRKRCARFFRADRQSSRSPLRRNRAASFFRLPNALQRHHPACARTFFDTRLGRRACIFTMMFSTA